MRFGLAIPTSMEGLMYPIPFFTHSSEIIDMCVEAEVLGFDSVWGNEHITRQRYVQDKWTQLPRYFEPLMLLSYVAAKTEHIKLATGIIPLPLRDPVLLARQACVLDNFSGGRLILGVGLGAYLEEFLAQYSGSVSIHRGNMLDEALEALIELLTKDKASFEGKYYHFAGIELSPPLVQACPPIYVGGNAVNNMKRAAKYGIGWFPAGLTPSELQNAIYQLKAFTNEYGQEFSKIDIAPQLGVCIAKTHDEAIKKYQNSQLYAHDLSLKDSTLKYQDVENLEERDLIGTVDEVIGKIEAYRAVGIEHMPALIFVGNNIADLLKDMQLFAKEIIPSFN